MLADSASEIVKFTISIPCESCTNAKAKYSSSVVPPDPSVHFTTGHLYYLGCIQSTLKGKGSPYSITERRVPQLIPVLGSQPAGYVSHDWQ